MANVQMAIGLTMHRVRWRPIRQWNHQERIATQESASV